MIYNSFHLNDHNIDVISYQRYQEKSSVTGSKGEKLSYVLKALVPKRARACLILHYQKGEKMTNIAKRLGISNATVSRDIQKAKSIIEKEMNI